MLTPAEKAAIREDRHVLGRESHRPLGDQSDLHFAGDVDNFGNPLSTLANADVHRVLAMHQRTAEHRARRGSP